MAKTKDCENRDICAECGGTCCKQLPGAAMPADFGGADLGLLTEAFKSGKWAVDWWEGDPTDGDLDRAYWIRPAIRGGHNLFDPSWGGTCIFHGDDGCALDLQDRPQECRELQPVPKPRDGCVATGITKKEAAIAWIEHFDVIEEAARIAGCVNPQLPVHRDD